ncbi:MAG: RAMP superfamily CRISPR-associated protein [Bacillota bacterium]
MSNRLPYFDPHGYFFVRLPAEASRCRLQQFNEGFDEGLIPVRGPFPPPNRKRASSDQRLFSGTLRCHLYCVTPVHIGSGSYRYDESAREQRKKVVADIVRDAEGKPVIPGSSLKGSFRAIAEAVSKSCVLFADVGKEERVKLPGRAGFRRERALFKPEPDSYWATNVEPHLVRAGRDIQVKIEMPGDLNHEKCRADKELCPCCAIFGKLGYRGRVAFTGARQIGEITPAGGFQVPQVVTIPARHSPQPHRVADKATWADGGLDVELTGNRNRSGEVQRVKLKIPRPLGRKFYPNWDPHGHFNTARYNWSQLHAGMPNRQELNRKLFQEMHSRYGSGNRPPALYDQRAFTIGEPHAVIPAGSILEFTLHFELLLPWELGLLLFSMGVGESWLPKIGGGKAYGLGSVLVKPCAMEVLDDVSGATRPVTPEETKKVIAEFLAHSSCHRDGISDLRQGLALDLKKEDLYIWRPAP